MKVMVRYGFILGLICIIAAGLLAAVNALTAPRILAQEKEHEDKTVAEVLPQGFRFEPSKDNKGEVLYYRAYDKDNKLVGVAFKVEAKGYSSTIKAMAGMDEKGIISTVKVLSQDETPGLGSRVAEPWFLSRFGGKEVSQLDKVEAITGATISSSAVIRSVKAKAEEIQSLLKNGK